MRTWAALLLLGIAPAALARGPAPESTHRGFLRQVGVKCFLEDTVAPPEERRLPLDGSLCRTFPQWRGVYLQVKGTSGRCEGSQEAKCLIVSDARPTLYDPIGRN